MISPDVPRAPTTSTPSSWSRSSGSGSGASGSGASGSGASGSGGTGWGASGSGEADAEGPGEAPRQVGPYRVGPRIGRGGMGSVHEATHVESGRRVALKLPKEGASARACARLLREARTARAAAGEHVVEVLDAGLDEEGRPFVAMEHLAGEDLGAWLRRDGRLDVATTVAVGLELLAGLERVHAAGIVHRDLKPENLVVVERPQEGAPDRAGELAGLRLKIVDFGVSKARTGGALIPGSLTRDGVVLGTPLYMSPEQAQGLPDVDERSDLWSVGAILFQCLAGRAPHAGATYEQIVVAVCSTDAPDVRTLAPATPAPIASVLSRALSRDRGGRFQDARSMRAALARAAAGESDAAYLDLHTEDATPKSTQPLPLLRRRGRPSRQLQMVVALASVLGGIALGVSVLGALDARSAGARPSDGAGRSTEAPEAQPHPERALPTPASPPVEVSAREGGPPARAAGAAEREAAATASAAPDASGSPPPAAPGSAARPAKAPTSGVPSPPAGAPRRGVAASLPLKER